jgi:tRNA G18 (ribose-2'-O)-methylase SpoU
LQALRSSGYKIAAVEQAPGSIPLTDWQPQSSERWAMVFGNEVRGISAETCALADVVLEIPQFGAKKSLNVSVCGGIALWYAAQAMGR